MKPYMLQPWYKLHGGQNTREGFARWRECGVGLDWKVLEEAKRSDCSLHALPHPHPNPPHPAGRKTLADPQQPHTPASRKKVSNG